MLDIKTLKKYDTKKIYEVYDIWPKLAKNSFIKKYEPIDNFDVSHLVFVGMGGSGNIGDIFSSILSKKNIRVSIVKGYELPKDIDEKSLVIATSISGNTDETLSVLKNVKDKGIKNISFTSGGKMEEYCKKNQMEYRKIGLIHSPRASFSRYFYAMIKILNPIIQFSQSDIENSINEMENTKKIICSSNLNQGNHSLDLAQWINKIPLLYFPSGLESTAVRFKNSLQENAKQHTIVENIIEACHNGVVPWINPSNVQPILIRGIDDHIKTKERYEILKEFFESKNIAYKEIFSSKGDILTKIMNLIYIFDYCSIYKAVLSGFDPSPIHPIDFVKSKLS